MLSKPLFLIVMAWALVQSQPDPNAAFFEALSAGDSAKVQKLLESGSDPNARSRTYPALVLAFWAKKPETPAIITALLKAGADPSAVGSDTKAAPQLAAEQPERSLIDAFLEQLPRAFSVVFTLSHRGLFWSSHGLRRSGRW
jgi:hypothetical protein